MSVAHPAPGICRPIIRLMGTRFFRIFCILCGIQKDGCTRDSLPVVMPYHGDVACVAGIKYPV